MLCCCCSRGNCLTGQRSALTRVSTNLPYQIETNLPWRSYQTYFASFLTFVEWCPSLTTYCTVAPEASSCSPEYTRTREMLEANLSTLMLITWWPIKKWMFGMLWSQPWRVSIPKRSLLSRTRHAKRKFTKRDDGVSIIATIKKLRMLVKKLYEENLTSTGVYSYKSPGL